MHPFHTIVVAVDFSDTSTDTIDAALELARGQQHRVHLLHVVADVLRSPGDDLSGSTPLKISRTRSESKA